MADSLSSSVAFAASVAHAVDEDFPVVPLYVAVSDLLVIDDLDVAVSELATGMRDVVDLVSVRVPVLVEVDPLEVAFEENFVSEMLDRNFDADCSHSVGPFVEVTTII